MIVSEARRPVLDHLGMHYRRTFADQWEFVRFAEEPKLGLDCTTPPKRAAPTAPAQPLRRFPRRLDRPRVWQIFREGFLR